MSLNGLSLLKCLFRGCREYLPILMLVSLKKGGLNQISSSIRVIIIIIIVIYLDECAGPTIITPILRAGVHWGYILQSALESAVLEGIIITRFEFPSNCTLYALNMNYVIYHQGNKWCNNSHTSSTLIDLYDIPHIFYTRIIHTYCFRALIGYY